MPASQVAHHGQRGDHPRHAHRPAHDASLEISRRHWADRCGRVKRAMISAMTSHLKNTVALVTGSSSGIGAATARRLAAEGAAVALVARRRDRLDGLAAGIRADGGTALVVQADVTSQREAAGAVETAVAELGLLDTVVNNAGIRSSWGQPWTPRSASGTRWWP